MSTSNKNLLGAVMLGAALFLVWMLDVSYFRQLQTLRGAITERKVLFDARKKSIDAVTTLHKEYEQKSADIARFSAVVPAKKSSAEVVSEIESMASGAGAQLVQVSVTADTTQAKQDVNNVLNIAFIGKGSYLSLVTLLDAMEKNIRLLDVNSIDVSSAENQANVLIFNVKAKGYYLK